jgi:hypothetical protein
MSTVKRSMIAAVCIALCVVLPMAFHAIPGGGPAMLPMHLPVLLCGLVAGWQYGLLTGIAGPGLSHLLTGMPPAGYLPQMTFELAIYGLVAGLMMLIVRTGRTIIDLYVALVTAMLTGRILTGVALALFFSRGEFTIAMWATSFFVVGIAGILIQLFVLPPLVIALTKAGLIPERYGATVQPDLGESA